MLKIGLTYLMSFLTTLNSNSNNSNFNPSQYNSNITYLTRKEIIEFKNTLEVYKDVIGIYFLVITHSFALV